MGEMLYDSNNGFILFEDEFGHVCSNFKGVHTQEFYNEGCSSLINVYEECY